MGRPVTVVSVVYMCASVVKCRNSDDNNNDSYIELKEVKTFSVVVIY